MGESLPGQHFVRKCRLTRMVNGTVLSGAAAILNQGFTLDW